MTTITYDELVAELDRLGVSGRLDDEGLTAQEWADSWKCSSTTARRWLNHAKQHGLLQIGRKHVTTLSGSQLPVSCYKLVMPIKTKKKKAKAS